MMWASAHSIFVLGPLAAAKSVTLLNYLKFIHLLSFLHFHVCNRTYGKKRDYFWCITRNASNPVEFQRKASAKELLDNAARVCNLHCRVAFDISSKKKNRGEIAVSVPDELLLNAAMHEGYLAQANHPSLPESMFIT
jgi:hypothetical protein